MANFYRLTAALIAVFFIVGNVFATGNDTPTGEPDDELFDYAFGKTPEMINGVGVTNCEGLGPKSLSECYSILEAKIDNDISNYGDNVNVKMIDRGGFVRSQPSNQISVSKPTWIQYWGTQFTPAKWYNYQQSSKSASAPTASQETPQCPPVNFSQYTIMANVGATLLCFSRADIQDRDSCPDDTQDGDYILPVSSNTASSVCLAKPDGSSCGYQQNGDVYESDVEMNCYEGENDDYSAETPEDNNDNDCVKIGGVHACPEDPQDKCTVSGTVNGQAAYSSCETGCGYADPLNTGTSTFVCLSGDEDNDGIPDARDDDFEQPEPEEPEEPEEPPEVPPPIDAPSDSEKAITDRLDIANRELGIANTSLKSIKSNTKNTTDELEKLNTETKKTNTGIGTLNDTAGGILAVNTEIRDGLKGEGTTFGGDPTNELTGFYTKEYEEGFDTVWARNEEAFDNSAVMAYLAQWEVTVSGTYDWPQFCFNLGFANFGCHQISIDSRIIAFIRVIMILGALILARQITLGG
jgi:hypothetical protein